MGGDNFQDVVVLRTDDKLEIRGEAVIIGGTATGAQSVVFADVPNGLEGHLAWNPDANHTIILPNIDGTLLISGQAIQGIGISTIGNTSGNTGTTVGTIVLAGGNQITLSQVTAAGSLATVTISGRDAVFGAGVSTIGNTAGNTGTRTGTIVFAGGNGITLSQSTAAAGATVTISGITQSVQPGITAIGVSTGGNTAGNTGTTQGTYVLAGAGAVTLSQVTAGGNLATLTINVPVQSIQPGVTAIGVSSGGNTAGNTGTTQGTYVLAATGNITLSQVTGTAGATVTMSVPLQSIQPGVTAIGVSTGGNTAGNTGTIQGTYVLVGGGAASLSQVTGVAGATVTISVPIQSVQPGVTAIGVSTGGNTAGNTGTTQGTYILAGAGAVTLSQSTAGGNLATLSINVPVQSVQPGVTAIGVSTGGNTLGNTGTTQGTIVLAGMGQVTLSQVTGAGGATVTISAPVQSVQPDVAAIGVSTGGNTSGNTGTTQGTVVLAGGNQITLSQSTAAGSQMTVTISARNAIFGEGISNLGNTSGTSGTNTGTIVLAGGNNITLSQSTGAGGNTITISAANSATVVSGIGVSTGGNTAGNTGTTNGTIVFAGIGNLTLSQSTAAGNNATISISGGFGTGVAAIGVSTGGNTSGNTATTQGTVVLAGGNNITLSQSTAAGSLATITISARNAVFGAGVSTGGNTSGTSGTNTGTIVWAGGNNITLSQATGAGGNTITISGASPVMSGGVSTYGNTTGNTGLVTGSLIFAGSNGVTLSQSTIAGGAVVWIFLKKNPIIFFATGRFRVSTGIDIQEAGDNFTISTVVLRREIAGSNGTTLIDVLKNGVSIWNVNPGNRPSITAASGDAQRVTSVPDVTSIASTDRLEMVIVTAEGGSPQDAVVELIFAS